MIDPRCIFLAAAALISAVVLLQFMAALGRNYTPVEPSDRPEHAYKVSVIIPARNEEEDLRASLMSVLRQTDVELDVIVVNDHSHDQTGAIAESVAALDRRVRVVHDPELPPGWLGKCNAMERAAALAAGDILLFSDADILHQPGCFAAALALMERRDLDFLSLFPRMEFVSTWENALLPALIGGVAMLATPGIEDPHSSDALAAGAFLMIRSRVFHAIGGFGPIKNEMLDDVALARLVKQSGYRVGIRMAPKFLSVRLFKNNRHAFWGTTKNVLVGLNGRLWLAPLVVLLPVLVFWTPLYCVVTGALEGNLALTAAAAATYALQYALLWSGRRIYEFHPAKALLFPLVAFSTMCCMMRALYLYSLRGAVEWRGRVIPVRVNSPPS